MQLAVVSGHSFNSGDTFNVRSHGSTYTSTLNSLTLVGQDLRDKINAVAGYVATYDAGTGTLVVRHIGATSIPTISASVIGSVGGTGSTASGASGIRELTIGGTMVPGEVWHVTITGSATVTVDYTVQSGDTKSDVATAIAALIDSANGGTYSTSVSGFVIAVDDTGSAFRPAISVVIDPTASPDATATPGATGTGNVAYATLGGNVVTDEVWTLNLAGQSAATYTVVGTKTVEDVGAGLLAALIPVCMRPATT
ncbi:MAG: hypothetical protein R3C17_10240 [Planctomycetaceae bacterium]